MRSNVAILLPPAGHVDLNICVCDLCQYWRSPRPPSEPKVVPFQSLDEFFEQVRKDAENKMQTYYTIPKEGTDGKKED